MLKLVSLLSLVLPSAQPRLPWAVAGCRSTVVCSTGTFCSSWVLAHVLSVGHVLPGCFLAVEWTTALSAGPVLRRGFHRSTLVDQTVLAKPLLICVSAITSVDPQHRACGVVVVGLADVQRPAQTLGPVCGSIAGAGQCRVFTHRFVSSNLVLVIIRRCGYWRQPAVQGY
jgi:hypothetical protein